MSTLDIFIIHVVGMVVGASCGAYAAYWYWRVRVRQAEARAAEVESRFADWDAMLGELRAAVPPHVNRLQRESDRLSDGLMLALESLERWRMRFGEARWIDVEDSVPNVALPLEALHSLRGLVAGGEPIWAQRLTDDIEHWRRAQRVREVLAHERFAGLECVAIRDSDGESRRTWVARINAKTLYLTSDTALGAVELAARLLLDGAEPGQEGGS